jgi:hypothetical protein
VNIFDKIKMKFSGEFSLFTKEGMRNFQRIQNRPSAVALKRAIQNYRDTKDERYNREAVVILTRFRVVLSDHCFNKLLRENYIFKDSAIEAMASFLNFTHKKEEWEKWAENLKL